MFLVQDALRGHTPCLTTLHIKLVPYVYLYHISHLSYILSLYIYIYTHIHISLGIGNPTVHSVFRWIWWVIGAVVPRFASIFLVRLTMLPVGFWVLVVLKQPR